MRKRYLPLRATVLVAAVGALTLIGAGTAFAFNSPGNPGDTGGQTITWTGQGAPNGALGTTECDATNDPNGANQPYLLWILTTDGGSITNDASTPVLHLGGTGSGNYTTTDPSDQSAAHFVTPYFTPDSSLQAYADMNVLTTGNGDWTLVISHGCPGTAEDLAVTKTATSSFDRTFKWDITKNVDKTKIDIAPSGSATFHYTMDVTHDSGTDGNWTVNGDITVSNPNAVDFTGVNASDQIDNGGSCAVQGTAGNPDPTNATIPASGSADFPYTCTYSSAPNPSNFTNTAQATWDKTAFHTPDGSASGTASGDFSNPTLVDDGVTVNDSVAGPLGTVSSADPSPTEFTYSHTFTGDPAGTCTTHDNTATFTTNTSGTTGSASQTVKVCVGADLTVSKTATPSFKRSYNWNIAKKATPTLIEQTGGGTASASYTVNVNETGFTDSGWKVDGTITVSNPNDWEDVTLAGLSDATDNGGVCTVTAPSPAGTVIPSGGSATFSYTCTFSSAPSPSSGTNKATATWDPTASFTADGSADGTAPFAFTTPTSRVNQTITPQDAFNGGSPVNLCTLDTSAAPGSCTLTAADGTPFTTQAYTYTRSLTVPANNCVKYTNIASILETGQSDTRTVEVCGPAKTGALTMGYWQNKNGQGIITSGASIAGVCNSGTWLRNYAPFQDLSTTATCSQVATYVLNIIKAANASGSSMSAMLKAQMLATALDVYFSDPGLGGNKIGAPAPIGALSIDLTKICKMIDGSGGTSTCSGSYENVGSAFGGATSLSVSAMLFTAAIQSNAGGSVWYGNVKATQQLAKDAFDAVNNQVAFSP